MARRNNPEDTVKVSTLPPPRKGVRVGKPGKVITGTMRMKSAAFAQPGGTIQGSGGNFYSPELSTDFLELPQSRDEQRNYYRHFYQHNAFVGQAIDLQTELPLSKVRLRMPQTKNRALAEKSMRFCEGWAKRIKLLQRLMSILHDVNLTGEAIVFCEDTSEEMPQEVTSQVIREITAEGEPVERWEDYPDKDERAVAWLKKNYKGWSAIRVLPPEQIKVESFPFTDERLIELVPDAKTKALVEKARQGDENAQRVVDSMPESIIEAVGQGNNLTLNTDPDAGSFAFIMARKASDYDPHGQSILQRCLRTLIFQDKIRQSMTSIASRHMTPYRLIYAENMNDDQTDALREQVDLALQDPDYSIITNFEVHWEEMGVDQRLPDWSWVYELTNKQLYAGLGVTESLLSGESSYSGDKIHLEVINTRFMLVRELLQDMVEEYFFKPMCKRMGFIEEDEDGNEVVITPQLSFTRLALRDNQETFDALWNLYTKGSLDIDIILDLLNIDPVTTAEKLRRDVMTQNAPDFNEATRALYGKVGELLAEGSDAVDVIAKNLGLKYTKPPEANNSRF